MSRLPASGTWPQRAVYAVAAASVGAALLVLAVLWVGPLPAMSRTAFSPHMLLHLGVVVIAAPALAFGLSRTVGPYRSFRGAMQWCLLAAGFEMVAVWGWHLPLLHDSAGHGGLAFAAEQLSFLLAGTGLWLAAFAARTRATAGAAVIVLFFTFTHMTMFGLLLTLSPGLLYDPQLCTGAFGFDPLNDQHFGGAIMAVGAGLPFLVATGLSLRLQICRTS